MKKRGILMLKDKKIILLILIFGFIGLATGYAFNEFSLYDKFVIQKCKLIPKSYERIYCLKPYFQKIAKTESAFVSILKAKDFQDNGIINDCHLVAHFVGDATIIKNNFDIGKSFAECPIDCIQGCYHGVMETYVYEKIDKLDVDTFLNICDSLSSNSISYRQCLHGIGHGLLFNNYLPFLDAVDRCHNLQTIFSSETCLGGLFMENAIQYLTVDEEKIKEIIPEICKETEQLDTNVTPYCIDHVGGALMFYTDYDLDKGLEFCQAFKSEEYKKYCISGARSEWEDNGPKNQI